MPYYQESNPVEVEHESVKYITEIAPDTQMMRAPEQEQDAQRAGGSAPRRKQQNQMKKGKSRSKIEGEKLSLSKNAKDATKEL